eukprot:TRINITY_DN2117_c0_g1_i3.p1 TRINITY_DN2117_c0_g1~~TRINITY_DN2117_c0_g1_i3.p1  ORF type:complete len:206 (-),score=52.85 TRINITY_DN2117_c0_g1_i3:32-649(-)
MLVSWLYNNYLLGNFAYVESWKAIELANSIFGFSGWSSSIIDITPDYVLKESGKFKVGVTAVVKVMLKDGTYHEDVGYGTCENRNQGTAIENAKKEAVSDARKRALRCFGNALGNCIYDKEHIKDIKKVKRKGGATENVTYEMIRMAQDDSMIDMVDNSYPPDTMLVSRDESQYLQTNMPNNNKRIHSEMDEFEGIPAEAFANFE